MTTNRRLLSALAASVLLLLSLPLALANATGSPTPGANPDLGASCGTDVTIVIDRSGSIGGNNTVVQQAGQTFIDALIGTGAKVQVVSFSDRATAEPGSGSDLSDLAFLDPSTLDLPTFTSSGSTNWDDALEMVRRSPAGTAPLTVMITDGDPTRRNETQPDGHGGTLAGTGSSTSQADLDAAVTEANAIKALPSHMFVVGVGSAVSNATSENRIKAISGPDKLTFSGETPNIDFGTADYTLVSEFAALKTTVAKFVRELCGPSLNVTKLLQRADGTTVPATSADPFTFGVSAAPTPAAWSSPAQGSSANATLTTTDGVANFGWDPATPSSATTVTLSEQAKAGWVYNGQKCWLNNLDGTPAALVVNDVGANAVGASKPSSIQLPPIGPYQAMNCEVVNRQVRTATVSVDKVTVPGGHQETFSFTLRKDGSTVATIPSLTDASPATAFTPVAPGTYDVVEGPEAHFTTTSATCDNLATQGKEQVSATGLVVGEGSSWQCTFTNTIHNGTIKVVKDLQGAPTGSFGFTSNVPGHATFSLTPTASTNAEASFSVAPGTYAVAESNPGAFALGASCDNGSTPGNIVVSPDVTTTCTFTNTAPPPSITVTKAAATDVVAEPGADVAYTITITNTSVEPLTITSIVDTVGGDTIDVLSLPVDKTTCRPLDGATVAAGATVSCAFLAPVVGNANTSVTDTVDVDATDSDGNVASDDASATVRVVDVAPTILVNKTTTTPSVPEPSGLAVYAVTVTNTSTEAVTLVSLTDQIGGGALLPLQTVGGPITQTSCALVSIAAGATYGCTFTAAVSGDAGDVVNDTVRATAVDDDGTPANDDDSASVTMSDVLPAISVTKTAGSATVAEPGGPVTFTVGITNLTAEPVTLGSIVDRIDGGIPFAPAGSCASLVGSTLAGHASTSCTFTVPVLGDASDGPIGDTVTVSAHDDDDHTVAADASAVVGVTDVLPTITVTKAAAPTSVDEPGGTVTFTVGVTNTSVEPVTIDAMVDKVGGGSPIDLATLPGTCDDRIGTSLAPGAATSCTFTLAVAGNGGDHVTDVVTVSAGDDDGNQATGSAQAAVDVADVAPSITVTKSASAASVPEPGGAVAYTVTVANHSVEPVTLTSLSDVVGTDPALDVTALAGTTCALPQVIGVDGSYSCTFTLVASGNADDTVVDTITASAHDDDENTVTATDTATVAITDVAPTVSVTKTATTPELDAPGGPASFDVVVVNSSPEPVTIDSITDTIGEDTVDVTEVAGIVTATTCATGTELAAAGDEGDTYECSFTVTVTGNEAADIDDVVTVVVSDDDGNDASDTDDATTKLAAVADLAIVKEATVVPTVGQTGTYTLTITNNGPSTAVDVSVTDPMPDFLTATSAAGEGWTCAIPEAADSVTCTRPSLAPEAVSAIVIQVAVGDPGVGIPVTNVATVSSPTPDPDETNNTDTVTLVPSRLLDDGVVLPTTTTTVRAPLAKTGSELRLWVVLADLFLIVGVATLLADPQRRKALR